MKAVFLLGAGLIVSFMLVFVFNIGSVIALLALLFYAGLFVLGYFSSKDGGGSGSGGGGGNGGGFDGGGGGDGGGGSG